MVIQKGNHVQIDIRTIKQAFEQLQKQEQDLIHVFQTLIQKLVFIKMEQWILHIYLRIHDF